jgi:hypothetical protein
MDALKDKVPKNKNNIEVVSVVEGKTDLGELTLKCKKSGSSDMYYIYADETFEAVYGRELARWLRNNEIAPEFKANAANAINRLLSELGIDAPRLTVQAPSDGTLHRTLPPCSLRSLHLLALACRR